MEQRSVLQTLSALTLASLGALLWPFSVPGVASAEPFKVGVITALTGPAAANGIAMRNSIELARQDAPDDFKNISIIYEDGAFDSKQALTSFMKLKDLDRVNLVYAWGVTYCKPIAPVAEASKTPVVCQGIEQDSYRKNPYLVRFMNSTDQYAKVLLEHLRRKKWRNVGIVVTENPYFEGMLGAVERNATKDVSITVVDRFSGGAVDMASSVAKLRQLRLDAVGIFLAPGQIGQFYRLMSRQKVAIPTFGTNCFENTDEVKLSEGGMEGAAYVHNDVDPTFVDRYERVYGNRSQLAFGAMAYEFGALAGALFRDADGTLSPDEVMRRLTSGESRKGSAIGPYRMVRDTSGDRFFDFPMALKEVSGTSYRIVERSTGGETTLSSR